MKLSEVELEKLKELLINCFHHRTDYSIFPRDELEMCITRVLNTINSTSFVISPTDFDKKSQTWVTYCGVNLNNNKEKRNEVYAFTLAIAVRYYHKVLSQSGVFDDYSLEEFFIDNQDSPGFEGLSLENQAQRALLSSLLETKQLINVLSRILPTFTQALGLEVLKRVEGTWDGVTGKGEKKEVKQRKSLLNDAMIQKNSPKKRGRDNSAVEDDFDNTDYSFSGSCHSPKRLKNKEGFAVPVLETDVVTLLGDIVELDDEVFLSKASSVVGSFGEITVDNLLLIFEND